MTELHQFQEFASKIDSLRTSSFSRLKDVIFLDFAGTGLYTDSQIQQAFHDLNTNLYGNPHSLNPSSQRSKVEINKIRKQILDHFNANSSDYSVIFTSGATSALKLVGETFPWSNKSKFAYLVENHNSVLGIREYAAIKEADITPCTLDQLENLPLCTTSGINLVTFPAESNFSGVKMPLELINKFDKSSWKVLIDAACFVSHSQFDLSKYPADFVVVSFYKIFGYPTGLGALIVKNDTAKLLRKTYFGGGTVAAVMSGERFHVLRDNIEERFEDGTLPFLSIVSLKYGFRVINDLGMNNIERYTHMLVQYLYKEMISLKHSNGKEVCVIYGNHHLNESSKQGPILAFNLLRKNGEFVGYNEVEQLASLQNIHLRTGCFCNPGSCHSYLNLTREEVMENLKAGHICWDDKDIIRGKPTGAIRVSLGFPSTLNDVKVFVQFIKKYFVSDDSIAQLTSTGINEDITLSSIFVYPIKSCGRYEVFDWTITSYGLLYDREWVLIDSATMSYINQKKQPKLCLIRPVIDIENDCMLINAEGMETLSISLSKSPRNEMDLSVCGDNCVGYVYGDEINNWFSEFLDCDCKLVRNIREGNNMRLSGGRGARSAVRREETNNQTETGDSTIEHCKISFSNESQYLIVSEESLRDLNSRLQSSPIPSISFRPNFVVKGGHPFMEDNWNIIDISGQIFQTTGKCNRCKMICVDQETAKEGREPLLTLASYRREKGRIFFGVHADHINFKSSQPFKISVNQPICIIKKVT